MAITLISEVEVTTIQVVTKFEATLDITTIKNSKFPVYLNTATPVEVANPFETIVIPDDYNSISKILTLTWRDGVLLPNTDYKIVYTGLQQPDGTIVDDVEVHFTTGASVTALPSELPPEATPVTIIDKSLISSVFTTSVISKDNLPFSVTDVDPGNGEYYLEEDYSYGRIIVKFSQRPAVSCLNSNYIKVQRKPIQRAPARWETLDVNISLDSNKDWVYIDLPSEDHFPEAATPWEGATPEHATPGFQYIEPNYRYRVIISKDFSNNGT